MKPKSFDDNTLTKEKNILNEISSEDVLYDETQTGPQEEPMLFEYNLDVEQWRKYCQEKRKTKK